MPKKIKNEIFKNRFLIAAQTAIQVRTNSDLPCWEDFLRGLEFNYAKGKASITWKTGSPGTIEFPLDETRFYVRGDSQQSAARQQKAGMLKVEDPAKLGNKTYFSNAVRRLAKAAGYQSHDLTSTDENKRYVKEREFHDSWANSQRSEYIDVRKVNEACTAPEMRFIINRLGNIQGKRILDVGCGLGEASVYFAMHGADVTSADLSPGMLSATQQLAEANGVSVKLHLSAAENMMLPENESFDIIYAGNLLHHTNIERAILNIKPHLAENGILVTWDPLAYNPLINIYRVIAKNVRTIDEHPLKWQDIKHIKKQFSHVEVSYFWLLTLTIFLIMAIVQGRNPNKERYWKSVVEESSKWEWIYYPLEKIDRVILRILPIVRLLCWNVVIVCRK